jgi:hypothetical protein
MCQVLPLTCLVALLYLAPSVPACCPASPSGKPVVNADQSVIIIWDAANKTQHFIRRASFKSDADDFGFLVPSPSQPELSESGNEAFPFLQKRTEPEKIKKPYPSGSIGCGCASAPKAASQSKDVPLRELRVLEEKVVAGFKAVVLETDSADALVTWLKENGYDYSPAVKAWAKPYVEGGWKITALKVAKSTDDKDKKNVAASALRLSFKTDRPLFPYREPESKSSADALGIKQRLLRIYFIADARYRGELTKEVPWTGQVAWAGKLSEEDRKEVLGMLKLPEKTGPEQWWLTEFEDNWPYRVAPADVYFSRDDDQSTVKRPPIIEYVSASWPADATVYALAFALIAPPLLRSRRNRKR